MTKREAVYILVALGAISVVYFLATSAAYEYGEDSDCGCGDG